MAGSLLTFTYTDDAGNLWIIRRDESNVKAVNGAGTAFADTSVLFDIPRNLQPRVASYRSADGFIQRDIVVLDQTIFAGLDGSSTIVDQVSGETLTLRLKKGEQVAVPAYTDTGLDDGTTPN